LRDPRENIAKTVEQEIGDEDPGREESHELDHAFQHQGDHHALMAFRGIEPPDPENYGENDHQTDNDQADIDEVHGRVGWFRYDGKGCDDGFELERDVGDNTDQGDDRRDCPNSPGFIVSGGDEVGDRGNPVEVFQPDHLAEQSPPGEDDEGRPQIDGEKEHAGGGGLADTAVIGPGGAVHGKGQGVDDRIVADIYSGLRPVFDPEGDNEKNRQIAEEDRNYRPPAEHQFSLPGLWSEDSGSVCLEMK